MDDNVNLDDDLNIDESGFDDFLLELGEEDDMDELKASPRSPVLCGTYRRPGGGTSVEKISLESSPPSSDQPSSETIDQSYGASGDQEQLNMMSNANKDTKVGGESSFSAERVVMSCEMRSVQLHGRPEKNAVKRAGGLVPNSTNMKAARSNCNEEVNQDVCKQQLEKLGSRQDVEANRNDDSDLISIYARDEDCSSLYQSSAGIVGKRRPWKASGMKKKVSLNGRYRQGKSMFLKPPDLRRHIRNKTRTLTQKCTVADLHNLLNHNRHRETVIAAENFCKMYMGNDFKQVDYKVYNVTRKLSEMLLHHHEMKYLYRIVRLAIDMQIVISEQVICGLIQSLQHDEEYGKINIILTQVRDKSLDFGDRVRGLVTKYLERRTPGVASQKGDETSGVETSRISNSEEFSESCNDVNRACTNSSFRNGDLSRKGGFLNGISCGPSESTWGKDPLYIQIPNTNNSNVSRTASFGCVSKGNLESRIMPKKDGRSVERNSSYNIDSRNLGKCVTQLLGAIGSHQVRTSLYSALAELITAGKWKNINNANGDESVLELKLFLNSAITCAINKERIMAHLSWICVEAAKQLPSDIAYKVAYLMREAGLRIVPPILDSAPVQLCRKARFFCANAVINNCLEHNDLDLGLLVVEEYFNEGILDFGPMLSPLICKMLCKVAELAYANKRYMDAGRCFGMYPAGFGDGSEGYLMEDILHGMLTDGNLSTKKEQDICNAMVEKMMARRMVTEVRSIIVKAFCANVVSVFKFLEAKGVYRRPQIARYPHLIIIPCLLCVEEMALMIQRHLTELAEFLMETGERIRTHIPLRIVLSKDTGNLVPIYPVEKSRMWYEDSLARLIDTITHSVNPNLKIGSQEFKQEKQEYLINVDIHTVRLWMLKNTSYNE